MNKLWDFLIADKATFEMELQKIIDNTVSVYAQKNPISFDNQIPFYQSETLVQELLQFSFTCKMDNDKIKAVLDSEYSTLSIKPLVAK